MRANDQLRAAIESGDREALIRLAQSVLDGSGTNELTIDTCEVLYSALDSVGSVKLAREIAEQIVHRWPDSPTGQALTTAIRQTELAGRLRAAEASGDLSALDREALEAVKEPHRVKARLIDRSDLARKFSKLASEDGEPVKALVWAEQAVAISDEESNQLRRAACLRRCGLGVEAIEVFEGIEKNGSDSAHVAATGRAATLADLGRLDEAALLIGEVVAARPRDAFALRCAGRVAAEQGALSEATAYFERVLDVEEGVADGSVRRQLQNLARGAARSGDEELAQRIRDLLGPLPSSPTTRTAADEADIPF